MDFDAQPPKTGTQTIWLYRTKILLIRSSVNQVVGIPERNQPELDFAHVF